ncbi:MAG TPA: hypothetical protein VIX80_06620 [Candidatus Kapabacteria bacterium]
MSYYAGQKLYCIDKKHPSFGKRVEVDTPYKELKDGSPVVSDPVSGKKIELTSDQLSASPPDERD